MNDTTTKVYKALKPFEKDGLLYVEGNIYELQSDIVATLPEGSVVEHTGEAVHAAEETNTNAEVTPEVGQVNAEPEGQTGVPAIEEPKTEVESANQPQMEAPAPQQPQEAKPWVGGHVVGRE